MTFNCVDGSSCSIRDPMYMFSAQLCVSCVGQVRYAVAAYLACYQAMLLVNVMLFSRAHVLRCRGWLSLP